MQDADRAGAALGSAGYRVVTVAEFPVVQHRHANGEIVTVRLRRVSGEYRASCSGCETDFVYRKPRMSRIRHQKSPLLPEVKGNYEDPDHDLG